MFVNYMVNITRIWADSDACSCVGSHVSCYSLRCCASDGVLELLVQITDVLEVLVHMIDDVPICSV